MGFKCTGLSFLWHKKNTSQCVLIGADDGT